MNYYDEDFPEVTVMDYDRAIPELIDPVFEGYCNISKPVAITPATLATTLEDAQSNFSHTYHDTMLICVPGDIYTYRLVKGAPHRDFLHDHPCAKLNTGSVVSFVCMNRLFTGTIKSVNMEEGSLTFEAPPSVPYMVMGPLGGDMEKKKTFKALMNLDKKWASEDDDVKNFFYRNKHTGGPLSDAHKFAYTQGVVGSGKSYNLCLDVFRHRTNDVWQIVTADTNPALTSNGYELERRGLRVLQFTRKDTPFAIGTVLKNNEAYKDWNQWAVKEILTESAAALKKEARKRLIEVLRGYVILVTPSKAENLRTIVGLDKEVANIYVDEAGLMTFTRFATLLLMRINKIWVYGDHRQHKPFDAKLDYVPPQDVHYLDVFNRARDISTQSVAWLFNDMNYPKRFLGKSRRLPADDAKALIPFFYEDGKEWIQSANWMIGKMPAIKKRHGDTVWVPPSILTYAHLSNDKKNKEAARLRRFLNWFYDYVKTAGIEPGKDPYNSDFVFISSHRHLLGAIKEELKKWFMNDDYDLRPFLFEYYTTRKAQGSTFKRVIYYTPESITSFINDSHHLVALSRHTHDLIVAPYHIRGIIKPGMLSALSVLGIVSLVVHPIKSTFSNEKKDRIYKVAPMVKDYVRLCSFFATKQFECYRKLLDYPYLDVDAQSRWRNAAGIGDDVVESFIKQPGKELKFGGDGDYKFVLLTFMKEVFLVTGPKNVKDFNVLNFEGKLVPYDVYGATVDIQAEWTPDKKFGKYIGQRKIPGSVSYNRNKEKNKHGRYVPVTLKKEAVAIPPSVNAFA